MEFESTLPSKKHKEDEGEPEISQVVICESTVADEVKKSLSEEALLLVRLDNMGGTQSITTVCDPEFYKDDVAEAATPRGDILELMTASESPDDGLSIDCLTPRASIFDSFAPGPEELACAPMKKVIRGAEILSRRQLNFESGDFPVKRLSFGSDDAEEEDQCLLVLENMILDLIMPDGFLDLQEKNETTPTDLNPLENCKTPESKPLLTGIATTFPAAPARPSSKVFKLSPSICRKIDFDSVSDSVYRGSSVIRDDN